MLQIFEQVEKHLFLTYCLKSMFFVNTLGSKDMKYMAGMYYVECNFVIVTKITSFTHTHTHTHTHIYETIVTINNCMTHN